jgi:hypothetical protein
MRLNRKGISLEAGGNETGDLLMACVKITTYNQPAAAGSTPSSEPWSSYSNQVYSGVGADAVIQSAHSPNIGNVPSGTCEKIDAAKEIHCVDCGHEQRRERCSATGSD